MESYSSSDLLKLFFNNTPDVVYVKDRQSAFLLASKALAHLMGKTEAVEIIGKTDYDFFPKELADLYYNDEQAIINSGVPMLDKEEPTYNAANPEVHWLSTSKIPFRNASGEIIGIMGTGRDITERRKIQEILRNQDIELSHQSGKAEVASDVIHNVGNVLNSIYVSAIEMVEILSKSRLQGLIKANELLEANRENLVDFVENDPKGKALFDYYLKIGVELVNEQNRVEHELTLQLNKISIIKEILDIQQNFAKSPSFFENINVTQLVKDSLLILQRLISKYRVLIETNIAADVTIHSNKAKLTHIIINIVKNAIEAMENVAPYNRVLIINACVEKNTTLISFIDKGEGIDKENLTRIFNHGFTTKQEGKGFGLHACANSMTELKGKITVKSDGIGHGSTFSILIPHNK